MIISKQLLDRIISTLSKMPSKWDGRQVIQEWKNRGKEKYWRQMEWIGWRFQELCEHYLEKTQMFDFSEQRYGYADFDAFAEIPWDYKAHIHKNSRGVQTHKVPGTDQRATLQAIKDNGAAGFIIGKGDAVFND